MRRLQSRPPCWVASFLEQWPDLIKDEDEQIWREWVCFKHRDFHALKDLLRADVRNGFKARALFIMLVPTLEWSPFYWSDAATDICLSMTHDKAESIPDDLVPFYAQMVITFCDAIGGFSPMGDGPRNARAQDAYLAYNRHLLLLLGRAPEAMREDIFTRYMINDPAVYQTMDESSGYNPFGDLLRSQVDEQWKRRADSELKAIILAELRGEAAPRAAHEAALERYLCEVEFQAERLCYSESLFASQVEFIVSLGDAAGANFRAWHVEDILNHLPKPLYSGLRLRLARFLLLQPHRPHYEFRVYDVRSLRVAKTLQGEFGVTDTTLAAKVDDLVEAYRARQEEAVDRQKVVKAQESAVLDRMR